MQSAVVLTNIASTLKNNRQSHPQQSTAGVIGSNGGSNIAHNNSTAGNTTHNNSSSSDLISNNNASINTAATSVSSMPMASQTSNSGNTDIGRHLPPDSGATSTNHQLVSAVNKDSSASSHKTYKMSSASTMNQNVVSGSNSSNANILDCSQFPQRPQNVPADPIYRSNNTTNNTLEDTSNTATNSNTDITSKTGLSDAPDIKVRSSSEPFPFQYTIAYPPNINSTNQNFNSNLEQVNPTTAVKNATHSNDKNTVAMGASSLQLAAITGSEITGSPGRTEYVRRQTYPQEACGKGLASQDSDFSSLQRTALKRENTLNDSANQEIQRMKYIILNKRENKKNKKNFLDDDKVLIGNKVSEGHSNYIMAYNMLTGIRVAVSRCSGIMKPLKEQDFKATKKLTFDITGNELTPSSKYDFKFKDYSPNVFRELREMFGLDPADYLVSLTAKYILSELNSPGKSGSFFYYSRDYKFIIKTIHRAEHVTLRRILKSYHQHVKSNPNTLVSQFYGLHRLKMPINFSNKKRKIYFIVMNNLFPPNKEIHKTYDLKGSLWKRETIVDTVEEDEGNSNGEQDEVQEVNVTSIVRNKRKPQEGLRNRLLHQLSVTLSTKKSKKVVKKKINPIWKDQNWVNNHESINLSKTQKDFLIKQLESDVAFLQKCNIMDYSLLLGIHDIKIGTVNNPNYSVFAPKDTTNRNEINLTNPVTMNNLPLDEDGETKKVEVVAANAPESPSFKDRFYFYSYENGFRSRDENNQPLNEIYYLGIIDCLTNYSCLKRTETFVKSFYQNRKEISAVPAVEYGNRFLNFMKGSLK